MVKMRMSKEEYDQLYFYTDGKGLRAYETQGKDPLTLTSPRRYDTLNDVRKAGLAKSKKEWGIIKQIGSAYGHSLTIGVFKGRRYLGYLEYSPYRVPGASYEGEWYPADRPKDPIPLYKDGSTTPASKPLAPPKKPVKASKPVKAAPKKPVSVAKPGTLVAVVDGKFAPVNGFRYPKTEIKALVKSMDSVYARMYDGELDETQWVPIGDTMLKNNPRLVAAVACERQDLLTSDREVAAFAYAVYHSKNRDRLMAMDRPAKARTPKTKRPTTAQMTFNPRTGKVGKIRRY